MLNLFTVFQTEAIFKALLIVHFVLYFLSIFLNSNPYRNTSLGIFANESSRDNFIKTELERVIHKLN